MEALRISSDFDDGAVRIFKKPTLFCDTSKNPVVGMFEVEVEGVDIIKEDVLTAP